MNFEQQEIARKHSVEYNSKISTESTRSTISKCYEDCFEKQEILQKTSKNNIKQNKDVISQEPNTKDNSKISTESTGSTISECYEDCFYFHEIVNHLHRTEDINIYIDYEILETMDRQYMICVIYHLIYIGKKIKITHESNNTESALSLMKILHKNINYGYNCITSSLWIDHLCQFKKNKETNRLTYIIKENNKIVEKYKLSNILYISSPNINNNCLLKDIWTNKNTRKIVNKRDVFEMHLHNTYKITNLYAFYGSIKKNHNAEVYWLLIFPYFDNLLSVMKIENDKYKTDLLSCIFKILKNQKLYLGYNIEDELESYMKYEELKLNDYIWTINLYGVTIKKSLHFHAFGKGCDLLTKLYEKIHNHQSEHIYNDFTFENFHDSKNNIICIKVSSKYDLINLICSSEISDQKKALSILDKICSSTFALGIIFPQEYFNQNNIYVFFIRYAAWVSEI